MSVDPQVQSRLKLALVAARAAGAETLRHFRQSSLAVERKGDGSPVTAADRASETLLREQIAAEFPDDGILGEEFGEQLGTSGYRWILDPIDGTKSFITGAPLYTTLVAIMRGEEPLAGVIYAPATAEIVYAARGGGAWQAVGDGDPQPARVSEVGSLANAAFMTTDVKAFGKINRREVYQRLESATRLARTWGDAYGYLLVACGRAEVMIDPEMNLWDAAALQPIIEEAGGRFFDWQGEPTVHSGNSVATNAAVAEEVIALITAD
ncbi:MAG: histidinol-phosphatase [Planctomycetaceae bacterium]|nr:histidinol-phosphatase [Planctomycetaceae bacterium]